MERRIIIYDTTLRDGGQDPEVYYEVEDKISIALELALFGIDYIEGGWPGSNRVDTEFFREIQRYNLHNAKIVAFGSTAKGIAEHDKNLEAIVNSKAPVATIFGKCHPNHVKIQLGMTLEENLNAIYRSVAFLKQKNIEEVYFDAEHFFDGFKKNKEYALSCLESALNAGADCLVLCDTNGGSFSWEVSDTVKAVKHYFKTKDKEVKLGIHCHNDGGFALANSLTPVYEGTIDSLQGTINGLGERGGNLDLCTGLPNLRRMMVFTNTNQNHRHLTPLSKFLYEVTGVEPSTKQPFVGENAFAHKGGIHLDAINKGASYEFMLPELVGNRRRIAFSSLAGRGGVLYVLNLYGFKTNKEDKRVGKILEKVQKMESLRYNIGLMEAEHYLLAREFFNPRKYFEIDDQEVDIHGTTTSCSLKMQVNGWKADKKITVSGGPVDALYHAMQQTLKEKYEKITNVELISYKSKALKEGAESPVRACCKFRDNNGSGGEWTTVGVNPNIVEASSEAVRKGFQYYLLKNYNQIGN